MQCALPSLVSNSRSVPISIVDPLHHEQQLFKWKAFESFRKKYFSLVMINDGHWIAYAIINKMFVRLRQSVHSGSGSTMKSKEWTEKASSLPREIICSVGRKWQQQPDPLSPSPWGMWDAVEQGTWFREKSSSTTLDLSSARVVREVHATHNLHFSPSFVLNLNMVNVWDDLMLFSRWHLCEK